MVNIYRYRQNNSGGRFIINDSVSVTVYIEADNLEEANKIAESIGIYFDGCATGQDCSCCGDRWYEPWDEEPDTYDSYEAAIKSFENEANRGYGWDQGKPEGVAHWKDNTVDKFYRSVE